MKYASTVKALIALLGCLICITAQGQTDIIVQISANGEIITTGEGGTPIAGVDTADYAFALSYGWTGEIRLDANSGLPTGRTRYAPLRFVKPLARSSILLRKALSQEEDVEVTLRLFADDGKGSSQEIYRIDLINGRVSGIRPFSDGGSGQFLEEIQISWQAIEFTDVLTDTSHVIQFPTLPAN